MVCVGGTEGQGLINRAEKHNVILAAMQDSIIHGNVAQEYADLIYNGLWFTANHQDLAAYVQSTQRHVSGAVRVKLHKGKCTVVGRKSPKSLYSFSLATYDKGDQFDHSASRGTGSAEVRRSGR